MSSLPIPYLTRYTEADGPIQAKNTFGGVKNRIISYLTEAWKLSL